MCSALKSLTMLTSRPISASPASRSFQYSQDGKSELRDSSSVLPAIHQATRFSGGTGISHFTKSAQEACACILRKGPASASPLLDLWQSFRSASRKSYARPISFASKLDRAIRHPLPLGRPNDLPHMLRRTLLSWGTSVHVLFLQVLEFL